MYRFSLLGLGWGTPCVPYLMPKFGIRLYKPKDIFREAKSLVVAICMAYVTAETSMVYFSTGGKGTTAPTQFPDQSLHNRSLGLAILYQFFRETVCDTRDIADDTQAEMRTLPIRIGKKKTLWLMGVLGCLLDAAITGGISINSVWDLGVNYFLLFGAVLRVGATLLFYSIVLGQPRENAMAWGTVSLLGLTPVIWAQKSLHGS
ncbi:hypothetical protein TSTA_058010 [Talaromyces stipitatus ATCC 10500]|uniref:Uncharacterized protein n=1 Tax=Talaromyces stipitatus (strain ATCC 10500 / CBS 375.48 / QM 6759 / NRRL 1006) TaxID=441959 RepID=B8MRX4_TALSN|nr:uncharacterized protein TSTA_058010 [Talaromyces stipitatus ATCC 10500]EED13312.1 hypothetical protein TSTA_058010 [Talaromyces stipitatus ATCC 10500]